MYEDAGVSVTAYRGDDITDSMMETAFFIYKSTIDKVCLILLDCRRDQIKVVTKKGQEGGTQILPPSPTPTPTPTIRFYTIYSLLACFEKPALTADPVNPSGRSEDELCPTRESFT